MLDDAVGLQGVGDGAAKFVVYACRDTVCGPGGVSKILRIAKGRWRMGEGGGGEKMEGGERGYSREGGTYIRVVYIFIFSSESPYLIVSAMAWGKRQRGEGGDTLRFLIPVVF